MSSSHRTTIDALLRCLTTEAERADRLEKQLAGAGRKPLTNMLINISSAVDVERTGRTPGDQLVSMIDQLALATEERDSAKLELAAVRAELAELRSHSIERVRGLWGDHAAHSKAVTHGWVVNCYDRPTVSWAAFFGATEREAIDAAIVEGERRQAEREVGSPLTADDGDEPVLTSSQPCSGPSATEAGPQTAKDMEIILRMAEMTESKVRITWHPQARAVSELSEDLWLTVGVPKEARRGLWFVSSDELASWNFKLGEPPNKTHPSIVAVEVMVPDATQASEPSISNPAAPRAWSEFAESGMLWLANRVLHVFGWAIVINVSEDGEVLGGEPRRTVWRGFPPESDARGFERVTKWMSANADALMSEVTAGEASGTSQTLDMLRATEVKS